MDQALSGDTLTIWKYYDAMKTENTALWMKGKNRNKKHYCHGYLAPVPPRPAAASMGALSVLTDIKDNSAVCHRTELCRDSIQPQPDGAWKTQGVNNVLLVMIQL